MPGGPELMVIMLVALLILGPDQLPKAMRTLGNARNEIKKVTGGFQAEIRKAMDEVDPRTEDKPRSAGGPADAMPAPTRPVATTDDTADAATEPADRVEPERSDADFDAAPGAVEADAAVARAAG